MSASALKEGVINRHFNGIVRTTKVRRHAIKGHFVRRTTFRAVPQHSFNCETPRTVPKGNDAGYVHAIILERISRYRKFRFAPIVNGYPELPDDNTLHENDLTTEMDLYEILLCYTELGSYSRLKSRMWKRLAFEEVTSWYRDSEFRRYYRMSRSTFAALVSLLRSSLQRNEDMARRGSAGVISPEVRLAITIRILAGGDIGDLMLLFQVGASTCGSVFRETISAIVSNKDLKLPGLPATQTEILKSAHGFKHSRKRPSPLYGCIGAVDGIAMKICKPPDDCYPREYYSRKGFYAISVQAVVDSSYRFLCFSARCPGSTHDSTAYNISSIATFLQSGGLPFPFWIAGDEAYSCTNNLLTPFSSSIARPETYEDSFNFFQSSLRLHVEQAFGLLVSKWRILRSGMDFALNNSYLTIAALFVLHNWCIDNRESGQVLRDVSEGRSGYIGFQDGADWLSEATETFHQLENDVQLDSGTSECSLRRHMVEVLRTRRLLRPNPN